MEAEQDLLFIVLSVQLGFATPQQVMTCASAWASDKSKKLSERLEADGVISPERYRMLKAMVSEAIKLNGGDGKKTLASFGGEQVVFQSFGGSIQVTTDGGLEIQPDDTEFDEDPLSVTPEVPGRYTFTDDGSSVSNSIQSDSEIGRGGIGRVFVAFDRHLGREVAIKELLDDKTGSDGDSPDIASTPMNKTIARFLREARVTGQLEHPNIVPVYEVGRRRNGKFYYTMKIVYGETLADAIKSCHSLGDRLKLLNHFADLCQAIAYAHSRGVIHRDIKPENVMVGEFGETVVLDWGMAKISGKKDIRGKELKKKIKLFQDGAAGKTVDGHPIGTPFYMSPEQAEGNIDDIDERSDVWGLGAVLYELLVGRTPFHGDNPFEVIGKVIKDPVPPIREISERVPTELAAVAAKALRRHKSNRYQTAKELADDVVAFQSGARVRAYEYSSWDLLRRFASKNKTALAVSLFALLLLLTLGVGAYFKVLKERERAKEFANYIVNDLSVKILSSPVSTPMPEDLFLALDYITSTVDPDEGSVHGRRDLANTYRTFSGVALRSGKSQKAKNYLEKAKDILQKLCNEFRDNPDLKNDLSVTFQSLGNIEVARGSFDEAKGFFLKSIEISEKLAASDSQKDEWQIGLSSAYERMGDWAAGINDYDEATDYYQKTFEVRKKLISKKPNDELCLNLMAKIHNRLGDLAERSNRLEERKTNYESALAYAKELIEKYPYDYRHKIILISVQGRLGDVAMDEGKLREARSHYQETMKVGKELYGYDPDNFTFNLNLSISYEKLGDLEEACGEGSKATEFYEKALSIREKLAVIDPYNAEILSLMASLYFNLGKLEKYYETLSDLKNLTAKNFTNDADLFEAAVLLGKYDDAMNYGHEALARNEEDASVRTVVLTYLSIAEVLSGKKSAAVRHLKEASQMAREIKDCPEWELKDEILEKAKFPPLLTNEVKQLIQEMFRWTKCDNNINFPQVLEQFSVRIGEAQITKPLGEEVKNEGE